MEFYLDTGDGRRLLGRHWRAENPELIAVLVHGYGEHSGRYEHVASAWGKLGISVVSGDLRGHGQSEGRRGYVSRFEEYHADVDALIGAAEVRADGLPIVIFGHSMGGLVTIDWRLARPEVPLAGVALSSPLLGLDVSQPLKTAIGRFLSSASPKASLTVGIKGCDVCRDPEISRAYDEDPLNNTTANARWFTEALKAIDRAQTHGDQLTDPTFLLYGGADRVVDPRATARFAENLQLRPQTGTAERLDDCFHELVNEQRPLRDEIIDRYGQWMLSLRIDS